MKNKFALSSIWNQILASPIGGKINTEASKVLEENDISIHCWNGERYRLVLMKMPDGCKYDPQTGKPVI